MATFSVTADNFRLDDAEDITGVTSRGGGQGPAAEAPLAYQGTNAWNRKITSSTGAGFEYDPAADAKAAQDMTAAARAHWMVKHIVSDSPGLRGNDGVRIIIGDGTNEYAFITAGTDAIKAAYDEYLLRTSHIIVPVNPNIAGYRDSTHSGVGVSLTAVDQFGIDVEFVTSTAKSENVGLDAIDLGTGLTGVGGDGADPDGTWSDFTAEDEGVSTNRWGYANSLYGAVLIFFGQMTVGNTAAATVFRGNGANVLWPDGLYAAGFSRAFFDLSNAGSDIQDDATHTSLGTTNVEDTRLVVEWSGTASNGVANHVVKNAAQYIMTSTVTMDEADVETADLAQNAGTIQNSTIRCTALSGVAVIDDFDDGNTSNTTFIEAGAGHAIEITAPGTYDFDALFFDAFGGTPGSNTTPASGATNAAIYNNSGGAVTINVNNGGDTPSVRNGTGATTTVVASVPVTYTFLDESTNTPIQGVNVILGTTQGGSDILDNVLTDVNGQVSTSFGGATPQAVFGFGAKGTKSPVYKRKPINATIASGGLDQTVTLVRDD